MQTKVTYIAEDGTEFPTEAECRDHELTLGAKVEAPAALLAEIIRSLERNYTSTTLRRSLADRLRPYLGEHPVDVVEPEG